MIFVPHIFHGSNQEKVNVQILPATQQDLALTWQQPA